MLNRQVLKDELTNDPLARGYAGMTDQQVADDMNTAYVTVTNSSIPLNVLNVWAAKTGVRAAIQKAAEDNASPVQSPCLALVDLFTGMTGPALEIGNSDNSAMMASLVSAGVMTSDNATSLQALTQSLTTRAIELLRVPASNLDIQSVRNQ